MTAHASDGTRVEVPFSAPSVAAGTAPAAAAFTPAAATTGAVTISVTECGNLTALPADVSLQVLGNVFTAMGDFPATPTERPGEYVVTLPQSDPRAGQSFEEACADFVLLKAPEAACSVLSEIGSTGGALEGACLLAALALFPYQPVLAVTMALNCDKAAKVIETTCNVVGALPKVCGLAGAVYNRLATGTIELEPVVRLHTLTGPRSLGGVLYRQPAPATGPFPSFAVDFSSSSAACTQTYTGSFTLSGPLTCLTCGGPPHCSDTQVYEFTNATASFPSFLKGEGTLNTTVQRRIVRGANSCYANAPTFEPFPCSYPLRLPGVGGTAVTNPDSPGVWPLLANSLTAQKDGIKLSGSFDVTLPLIGYTGSLSGKISLHRTPNPLAALTPSRDDVIAISDLLFPDAPSWPDGATVHRLDSPAGQRLQVRVPAALRGMTFIGPARQPRRDAGSVGGRWRNVPVARPRRNERRNDVRALQRRAGHRPHADRSRSLDAPRRRRGNIGHAPNARRLRSGGALDDGRFRPDRLPRPRPRPAQAGAPHRRPQRLSVGAPRAGSGARPRQARHPQSRSRRS